MQRITKAVIFIFLSFLLVKGGLFAQAGLIADSLDDNALAAQVLLTGIDGNTELSPAMKSLLERIPTGGIMLFRYNLNASKSTVKEFLSETGNTIANKNGITPFMAVDHEGGLVHRFGPGVERLPSAFSFWELAQREGHVASITKAEELYRRSASEIRELGITMVLAPVVELLNEENRLFLETRSYGSDPDFVIDAASAFIKSMNEAGITCVLKHFPGNTAADPHSGVSTLTAGKTALDEITMPFAGIIRGIEMDAVMVSHVNVPAVDSKRIASLSAPVIEGWLRGELGFNGIVIADDFTMAAVSASGFSPAAAAVEAINSGVDMIMVWPNNIEAVHGAILSALKEGRLSREKLTRSAERIIEVKLKIGLVTLP